MQLILGQTILKLLFRKLKSKKLKIEREDLKKLYKVKQKELQKSSTDFYLNTLLRAFLDVCINSNLVIHTRITLNIRASVLLALFNLTMALLSD